MRLAILHTILYVVGNGNIRSDREGKLSNIEKRRYAECNGDGDNEW